VVAVRTLIVTVSPLLADLVKTVLRPHLFLDVVEVLSTRDRLMERLHDLSPDLVLLGLLNSEDDSCAVPLLAALVSVRILALAANGAQAWLYEAGPHRTALSKLSPSDLIDALKISFDLSPPMNSSRAGPAAI
jgi:DNA-binding NarL/FixJ family response regulator